MWREFCDLFHIVVGFMVEGIEIRPLCREDLVRVKAFSDRWIGRNYFTMADLETTLLRSRKGGLTASFTAWVDGELAALRLTYAPGSWLHAYREKITPKRWRVSPQRAAYFKSLFIAEKFQRRGLGTRLSKQSLAVVREMGCQAVLCHSWLESPGNSSQKYLNRLGFQRVEVHPGFWENDACNHCLPEPCTCTGVEMIKLLS